MKGLNIYKNEYEFEYTPTDWFEQFGNPYYKAEEDPYNFIYGPYAYDKSWGDSENDDGDSVYDSKDNDYIIESKPLLNINSIKSSLRNLFDKVDNGWKRVKKAYKQVKEEESKKNN